MLKLETAIVLSVLPALRTYMKKKFREDENFSKTIKTS